MTRPVETTFSEDYLKPEPLFESVTMCHDLDNEFYQDLVQWCSAPAKEEQVQTTDVNNKTEERAHNIDTPHTPFSPQGWEKFDVSSPFAQAGFYTTPMDPLSPTLESFSQIENNLLLPSFQEADKDTMHFQEQFLDLNSLPVVLGDLTSEEVPEMDPWHIAEPVEWINNHDTDNVKTYTNTLHTMPYMDPEDSLDLKSSVIPREVEINDVVVTEYIINEDASTRGSLEEVTTQRREGLTVDVTRASLNWPNAIISTPEVLSYVEQMEKETCSPVTKPSKQGQPAQESVFKESFSKLDTLPPLEYEPITPKSESNEESENEDTKLHTRKRKRHDSEDSDKTYKPYSAQSSPRKYTRRKPNVPIKDMILALEGSQQLPKARRGRPPKRRESTVSSVCSVDENSSTVSTHETKYRELRDKNNEASKRSRMNRKLKELQMEQLACDLEERNKKLKVRADILEDMTKRLKEALMTSILQK